MTRSTCDASNVDIGGSAVDGNTVITYICITILPDLSALFIIIFFFFLKKERWTWNKFTTFNGGVKNVNLGGGRDVNSIGIRAVLRWIYMNIRDGYAIAGIYWDMTFWAVNNSYPLHLKIITVVKVYSLQLHIHNKRIFVSETLVRLINTDNIHVSFPQGGGCIS